MAKFRIRFFIQGDKFTEDEEFFREYEASSLEQMARQAYMDYWYPLSNLATGPRKVGVFFERYPCRYFEMSGWMDGEPIDESSLYDVFYWERIRRYQRQGTWKRV